MVLSSVFVSLAPIYTECTANVELKLRIPDITLMLCIRTSFLAKVADGVFSFSPSLTRPPITQLSSLLFKTLLAGPSHCLIQFSFCIYFQVLSLYTKHTLEHAICFVSYSQNPLFLP